MTSWQLHDATSPARVWRPSVGTASPSLVLYTTSTSAASSAGQSAIYLCSSIGDVFNPNVAVVIYKLQGQRSNICKYFIPFYIIFINHRFLFKYLVTLLSNCYYLTDCCFRILQYNFTALIHIISVIYNMHVMICKNYGSIYYTNKERVRFMHFLVHFIMKLIILIWYCWWVVYLKFILPTKIDISRNKLSNVLVKLMIFYKWHLISSKSDGMKRSKSSWKYCSLEIP